MQIVDYSFARPGLNQLADYHGVARYLANINDPKQRPKILTPDERDALLAAGKSICVAWESYASRAGEGYNAGRADCGSAEALADSLAVPADAAIYYAVDYDADPATIRPYFQGVNESHRRPVGGYGSFRVVEALFDWGLITYGWQATAWSKGQHSGRAHLFQRVGSPVDGTDVNDVLQPDWGQWPRTNAPGDDMTPDQAAQLAAINAWVGNITPVIQAQIANALNDPNAGVLVRLAHIEAAVAGLAGVQGGTVDANAVAKALVDAGVGQAVVDALKTQLAK